MTVLETTSLHSSDDPGFFALEMLLRLAGLEVDVALLRSISNNGPVDVASILAYARKAELSARCIETRWIDLPKYALPGIIPLRNGSFSIVGSVAGEKVVVLHAGASRPSVLSEAQFTSLWDGRLLLIQRLSPVSASTLRIRKLLTRILQKPRRLDQATSHSPPGQVAVLVTARRGAAAVSSQARKFGSAVANLKPRDQASQVHELAFLPAALEIVETPPSPIGRAVAYTIASIFTFALIWATFGTVDIVATAPGKFVPSGRTKSIQPLEAGVIRAISVTDGQAVRSGDPLIAFDATMSTAELGHLKSDLLGSELDVARLKAALNKALNPLTAFAPPDHAPLALVEMHRRFLISQTAEQAAKLATINGQIAQKEAERATSKALSEKLRAVLNPLQQRVEIREQLFQKGLGSKINYLTELQDLVTQRQELTVQDSRHSEAEAAIAVLVEMRTKAVAEYERSLFEELAKAEQKVAGLTQDVIKAERRTALQTLTAPIDGTVQQLAVHTVGGVATPAQTLMLIVPEDSRLEIEANISNRDIGFVEPGQDVAIKVDTFNFTRYGLLSGKILSISKDAITRNKPPARGVDSSPATDTASSEPAGQELVYSARISVDRKQMDVENRTVDLSAGMAVTAEINIGSRRIISYIMSPLLRYKQESLRER
ncbi:HlyD family type I secretion periplasmic adaptor subunit [Tardiphaga sp. 37S4]|uniref:HlyD family type I secretion periplasmic adaptor subunit n=1 Tax=Tardiphaga TaxID=1395974 RepID=UPI001E57E3F8|nr:MULTISPECIES: HlyD family type I secretion periplasmic adaptor subunit [Tardiphaga]MDR6661797.1 hemolysin D [Tardiphaga robiniae]UFS73949.1 HlyD family type I secretion periplasmic adaptor subunit [Tardiphaga sp. 37S4]